jgi:tetratricopeptide (TPR) repeat protein
MDALKRAETSQPAMAHKLTGSAPAAFSLEPIPCRSDNSGQSLPNLAQHIDSLNAELEAGAHPAKSVTSTSAANPQPAPGEEANRAAIRNAFAAKETKAPSRKPLWLALGSVGVAAISIGAYAWYPHQGTAKVAISPPPAASEAMPTRPVQIPAPKTGAPSVPAVPIFAANSPSTATFDENPERMLKPAQRTDANRDSRPNSAHENETSPPVRLIRTQLEPDAHLQHGYAYPQGNSLDQARREYEQVLRNDPNQVDALLGLAAIAQRQGRNADAERYRQLALIANPRDAGAQAAALSNNNGGNSTDTESRLKTLLSAQPESAQLNFALGNLFAKQARWNEAQQVYFNAVAGDTDNPDYLFNLAVSLDQLHQPKLAAQHYRLALEAAERRPAAFDRARTNQRLSQLAP